MTPLARLVRRIGRHGSVYLAASGLVGLAGVVQVSVLTRLLSPAEFGQLALLTVLSVSLTVLLNLGSLQGSFRSVFGTSGDDELDDERDDADRVRDPRAALGNALALTAAVGVVGAAVVALLARPLAELALGEPGLGRAVAFAGLAGSLGAVWRLAVNVPRLERRAAVYAFAQAGRALLVLSGMTVAVGLGAGVEGAVAGMAAGTGLALAIALVVIRRSFTPTLTPSEWPRVLALGAGLIPVVIASWAIQNGDVLILSAYAPESEVGIYRAGSRIAALVAYFTSALLMAWGPLTREPLQAAVDAQHGRLAAGARMVTWFLAACLGLLLAVTLFAGTVVRVAGSSFDAAGTVIPIIAAALVVQALFVALYRVARVPRKRRAFVALWVLAATVFAVAAVAVVPALEGLGAALAVLAGYSVALSGMLLLSQRGHTPLPLDGTRLGAICSSFAVALVVGLAGRRLLPSAGDAVAVVALASYPAMLVLAGAVPRSALTALRGAPRAQDDLAALSTLAVSDAELVRRAVGHSGSSTDLERLAGGEEGLRRVGAALRAVAAGGRPHAADAAVARHLLSQAAPAERDRSARRLWTSEGVDPLELEALEACLERLRQLAPERWRAIEDRRLGGGAGDL